MWSASNVTALLTAVASEFGGDVFPGRGALDNKQALALYAGLALALVAALVVCAVVAYRAACYAVATLVLFLRVLATLVFVAATVVVAVSAYRAVLAVVHGSCVGTACIRAAYEELGLAALVGGGGGGV